MKKRLNSRGLVKLVEYLDQIAPGIAKKIAIRDGKLVLDDIELTAEVLVENVAMPPSGSMTDPGKVAPGTIAAAKELSPEAAVALAKPDATAAQPQMQPQQPNQPTQPIVGKSPTSDVKQVGRAASEKAQQQNSEQMMAQLSQQFPNKQELQQAFQAIAQQFAK